MTPFRERTPRITDTLRVLRIGARSLYRSRLPQMAAALAFRTLFALIPMLVISVAAIGAFAEPEDVEAILSETLDTLGLSDIQVSETYSEDLGPSPEEGMDPGAVRDGSDRSEPERPGQPIGASPEGDSSMSDTVLRLEEIFADLIRRILEIPFAAIGAVGLLTLIYASISMLVEIERTFNTIYRAQIGKSWGKRIVQYWVIITLVPILLFTAFYASEQFRGIGVGIAGSVVSVAVTTLLLLLAYQIIPNTRVHVRTGVIGALVAAILWEFAKWGFREYVVYSASYAKLYGSMAMIPLFMLWVYLTWLIILFGLQIAYGLQHIELARQINEEDAEKRLTDPAAVLGVLALIAERFARGRTTGPRVLADELNLPPDVVVTLLDKLTRAGVLHPVDGPLDNYALARPAEAITLEELLTAVGEITDSGQVASGPWTGALARIRAAQLAVIRGESVASLIAEPGVPASGERSPL